MTFGPESRMCLQDVIGCSGKRPLDTLERGCGLSLLDRVQNPTYCQAEDESKSKANYENRHHTLPGDFILWGRCPLLMLMGPSAHRSRHVRGEYRVVNAEYRGMCFTL